jgi:hypothetical protein
MISPDVAAEVRAKKRRSAVWWENTLHPQPPLAPNVKLGPNGEYPI